ncbi:hypothetical protein HDR63_02805, partial [bacterium]|nr:hypothetical protein [bacterium]
MTHQKRFFVGLAMVVLGLAPCVTYAATATRRNAKQSAISSGTTIRERVAVPAGLYDQDCYDAYYGCMDQFCVLENFNGGSCACSDQANRFEERMAAAKKTKAEAERIKLEEVERVNAGGAADIIFNGSRRYDKNGNVIFGETDDEKKAARRADLMAIFESSAAGYDDDDMDSLDLLADKTGVELFRWAESVCMEYVPAECDRDVQLLRQVYSKQITADCKGFENDVIALENEANDELTAANAAVRTALAQSLESSNQYNLGECTVHFKECMQKDEACGPDWENCVSIVASENMQNNRARSTANTKVQTVTKYSITASTMEILNAKRNICERVLDSCMSVRDEVWPAFLRDAAPTLKNAEQIAESRMRQSCLTDISDCIQVACKDNIAGPGKDTMDACLSRPDMVRSFCKLEIDRCERMEPQIWDFVQDKLAALRVDACTQEVKDCFTADTRCGADFSNCIGMDYDYIHNICPIDSLVVCKQGNPKFSMDDLDSMLMGLYLNIDNAALTQCQNLVDTRMSEICGAKSNCNRFAADSTIGTGSLRSQKVGTTYRVTGMISFGSIKIGEATGTIISDGKGGTIKLEPGEIGVQEYLAQVRDRNTFGSNDEATISLIEEELNNIAGTINRTIEMIEQDPQIQF